MKKFVIVLTVALLSVSAASAQIVKFGLHGGVNDSHYSFKRFTLNDVTISPVKGGDLGYQIGAVLRLSIPKFINIQTELNYQSRDYAFYLSGSDMIKDQKTVINYGSLKMPVTFGFNLGALRLFAGPVFTLNSNSHNKDEGSWLDVNFDDNDIALVVGGGFEVKKFFIDLRYTTFTGTTYSNMSILNKSTKVETLSDELWEVNIGFFF